MIAHLILLASLGAGEIFANGFDGPTVCAPTIKMADGPRALYASANVIYGIAGGTARPGVKLGEYDNIWGYNDPWSWSPQEPWPGVSGSSPYFPMPRTSYFGAHFRTTPAPVPGGYFVYGNYGGTIPISMSISRACGDFAGDPATNGCYVENHPSDDGSFLRWQFGEGVSPFRCYLRPDADYYLNVTFTKTNPAPPLNAKCKTGAACTVLIKSMGH